MGSPMGSRIGSPTAQLETAQLDGSPTAQLPPRPSELPQPPSERRPDLASFVPPLSSLPIPPLPPSDDVWAKALRRVGYHRQVRVGYHPQVRVGYHRQARVERPARKKNPIYIHIGAVMAGVPMGGTEHLHCELHFEWRLRWRRSRRICRWQKQRRKQRRW